ncbi:MAG: 4,4'-diaponeurosporenoate glycosyltransferase [Firmicutes bacterium ADurb.Bin153]|nr:MAG: 4,4'-diaponeurosporenoate glycosyltransferase [Firmicutes bacterium ADurb.Bin153]
MVLGAMSLVMASQAQAIVFFLSAILLILLTNIVFMGRLKIPPGKVGGKVSILVPTRNEEANIRRCVESLVAQAGVDHEVIVLDDGSTDRTAAILAELALRHSKLKVVKGKELPAGWTGKNHACWLLAEESSGDVLFFTDADTYHSPNSAAAASYALRSRKAGLVSGIVRQEYGSFGEMLTVPVMNWALLCFMPVMLSNLLPHPLFSSACGQFMVFDRGAYLACGGHKAVKGQVLEDMELARLVKKSGSKALLLDATELVSCRMYAGFADAVGGFTKNLFAVFRNSILTNTFVWTWLSMVTVCPVLYLLLPSYVKSGATAYRSLASVALCLLIWVVGYHKSKTPLALAVIYPFSVILWSALALRSMVATITGRSTWKERRLPKAKVRLV